MATFVIGDIHGGHKAMLQCFERAGFNYEKDELICLGDVVDGWPDSKQCFDELLKIKNLIMILGNHDWWFLDWAKTGKMPHIWVEQGGRATIDSYERDRANVPESHIKLLESANIFFVDEKNRAFVHGGFNPVCKMDNQSQDILLWDRDLLQCARFKDMAVRIGKREDKPITRYSEVFVGHTTTYLYKQSTPVHFCEVWGLDTGGGWEGYLTIMELETKQYWQSDMLPDLYPEAAGRRG